MPVQFIKDPNQVGDAINESNTKPVVIHYWNPLMGEESPFLSLFHDADENLGPNVSLYVVDSGFINPPHDPQELPLTALYVDGKEKQSVPFNVDQVRDLIFSAV
ncbi:hypothetical protein PENSTE_c011G08696 [Penicillium steckii]|uniref:Thioredoxin domain-containing protein n=1 Tax=Penicillium steckii TaxID=303698 RepID=A0A1V6T5T0_9EURO|nr:hypothetical protein PENSTE_c011G08696 [Penicillium steckii]